MEITGEGTAVAGQALEGGKAWVCVLVEKIGGKDAFVGLAERGAAKGGKYLPEVGYAVRGGADKGRLKSTPQFAGGGGRVLDTGAFLRNFQAGEVRSSVLKPVSACGVMMLRSIADYAPRHC